MILRIVETDHLGRGVEKRVGVPLCETSALVSYCRDRLSLDSCDRGDNSEKSFGAGGKTIMRKCYKLSFRSLVSELSHRGIWHPGVDHSRLSKLQRFRRSLNG